MWKNIYILLQCLHKHWSSKSLIAAHIFLELRDQDSPMELAIEKE